jgi:hypothetical protein
MILLAANSSTHLTDFDLEVSRVLTVDVATTGASPFVRVGVRSSTEVVWVVRSYEVDPTEYEGTKGGKDQERSLRGFFLRGLPLTDGVSSMLIGHKFSS